MKALMDKNFPKRLARLRQAHGLTLKEVGRAANVTPQTVSYWEKGQIDPRPDKWPLLARFFGVHQQWLFFGTGPEKLSIQVVSDISDTEIRPNSGDTVSPFDKNQGKDVPLVVLEEVKMPRSLSGLSNNTHNLGRITTRFPCSATAFAFEVKDRSMSPSFDPGDIVVIDPEIKVEPGDSVVVHLRDRAQTLFRQLSYGKDGQVILSSVNPHYETVTYSREDWAKAGRVIGTWTERVQPNRR